MCCTPPLFSYRGRAFLVSGSSGTGKSTHSALWHDLYQTPLLNGDLNLLGIRDNIPYAYGLPWCGTSGICTPKDYPLGGIIFLKQAAIDQVQSLQPDEKVLHILQRMISPGADKGALPFALCIFPKPSPRSSFPARLYCTKEPSAAGILKAAIDASLEFPHHLTDLFLLHLHTLLLPDAVHLLTDGQYRRAVCCDDTGAGLRGAHDIPQHSALCCDV